MTLDLLRFGRGVDTRRLAATGFAYRATSAGAVRNFIRAVRLRRQSGRTPTSYTYEHDVEQFFRHSPSVLGTRPAFGGSPPPVRRNVACFTNTPPALNSAALGPGP